MEKVNPKVTQQQKRKREQESKEVKEKSKGKQGKYEGKKKVLAEKSAKKSAKESRKDSEVETGKESVEQDKEEVEEDKEEVEEEEEEEKEEEEEDSDALHAPATVQLEDVGLDDNRTVLWSYSNMKLDLSQYELENFDECIRTIDVDSVRFLGKPHDLHLLKNVSGRSGDRL